MKSKRLVLLFFILASFLYSFSQSKWAHVTISNAGIGKTGILAESGKIIVPLKYDMIIGEAGFYFVKQGSLWGCYNSKGDNIIPMLYQDIGLKVSGEMIRVKKNDKWGFVDLKNTVIIDFKFDFACNFYGGKAYTKNGNNKYYIDRQGNIRSSASKDQNYCPEDSDTAVEVISQFNDSLLVPRSKKGKYGVVYAKTNKVVIPFKFDEIGTYFNNTILVRKGNKWGAYTDSGKLITNPEYDSIGLFWD